MVFLLIIIILRSNRGPKAEDWFQSQLNWAKRATLVRYLPTLYLSKVSIDHTTKSCTVFMHDVLRSNSSSIATGVAYVDPRSHEWHRFIESSDEIIHPRTSGPANYESPRLAVQKCLKNSIEKYRVLNVK